MNSRYPYTLEEDKKILRYILDGTYELVVGGNTIWRQMEEEKICPNRSWQSLKNRFKRNIVNDLSRPQFGLTNDEKILLRAHKAIPPSTTKSKPSQKKQNQNTKKNKTATSSSENEDKDFFSLDMDSSDDDD